MSYNIINDFGTYKKDQIVKDVSVSAYWVVAVFPLTFPATYKRTDSASFDKDVTKGVQVQQPLILFDSVQAVNVNHNKNSHIGTLNAVLYPTEEYLSLINPGDFVFCWMMNSDAIQHDIIDRLGKKQACNKFTDGLKFYGRVNSIREQIHQQPDGARIGRFVLNANSFSEFDATFFYEQHLSQKEEGIATQLSKINLDLDKVLDTTDGQRGIVPNKMVVALIDIFLGVGVNHNLQSGQENPELQSTFGTEGDYAHILPENVGLVINKSLKSGKALKTADTVEIIHGVQNYSNGSSANDPSNSKAVAQSFAPDDTITEDSRRFTGQDLLGRNSPVPPALINQSLWSICQQYLNPSCNEMFTTLRANPNGDVVPTVIVRQMPFTTDAGSSNSIPVTHFKELPRWTVPAVLVKQSDVGRSDALRFNFLHVYGTTDTVDARNITQQMVDAPPKFDAMDIARSGLRPLMMTVPCWVDETREDQGPQKWMTVLQDFIFGQHMTLTGTITTVGIQSPICVGDNLEWDKVLYHIENIGHACSISADGHKSFTTTLGLTHGMGIDSFDSSEETDVSLYARTDPSKKESTYLPATNKNSSRDINRNSSQALDFPDDTTGIK